MSSIAPGLSSNRLGPVSRRESITFMAGLVGLLLSGQPHTAGVADELPAPILHTLLTEPVVKHHFEPEAVVTTIDGVHGLRATESVKQAALADTLVVTKVDVADAAAVGALEERLRRLNPLAPIVEAAFGDVEPAELLGGRDRDPRSLELRPGHEDGLHAFCLFLDERVDWEAFAVWLTMLLASHGQDVLRVKGLLDVGGPGPVLLNGVPVGGMVTHTLNLRLHPESLGRHVEPFGDRRSRLVFIVRGLEQVAVESSLAAFNRLGAL